MPRPTTKEDLINSANSQFVKMWKLIEEKGDENLRFTFDESFNKKEAHWSRDKNLRDVLIHLYEWHELLLHWIRANMAGEAVSFLPAPYNWRTYGQMNVELWEKHQITGYDEAKAMLKESHTAVMELIEGFDNDELFTKGSFSWAGTSTVGSYCISATSSHYAWAVKKIKLL